MISDYLDSIEFSLDTEIRVSTEIAFLNLIHELGYRESKMWSESEDELLKKLMGLAHKQAKEIMELIKKDSKKESHN